MWSEKELSIEQGIAGQERWEDKSWKGSSREKTGTAWQNLESVKVQLVTSYMSIFEISVA